MGWARERKGKGRRVCASGGERAEKMPRACKWARKREQKSGGDANERARGRGKESERVGRGTYRSGSGVVEAAENAGIGDVRLAIVDLVGQGNRVAARAITETVAGGVNADDLCGVWRKREVSMRERKSEQVRRTANKPAIARAQAKRACMACTRESKTLSYRKGP